MIDGLFERILVGLPGACASLDDDARSRHGRRASATCRRVSASSTPRPARRSGSATLRALIERDEHPWPGARLVLPPAARSRRPRRAELQRLARLALSPVTPAAQAAAWVEGVLRGSGLLLLHQDGLWPALDRWLRDLDADTFTRSCRCSAAPSPASSRPSAARWARRSSYGCVAARGSPRRPQRQGLISTINAPPLVLPVLARILGVAYQASLQADQTMSDETPRIDGVVHERWNPHVADDVRDEAERLRRWRLILGGRRPASRRRRPRRHAARAR